MNRTGSDAGFWETIRSKNGGHSSQKKNMSPNDKLAKIGEYSKHKTNPFKISRTDQLMSKTMVNR